MWQWILIIIKIWEDGLVNAADVDTINDFGVGVENARTIRLGIAK